ncbi:hypothetical protein LRAMOSA05425 [Lichtheimia ramosa]|uniref:Uncharacterized protein n=1 Tax=Lichtheimia ramosa TaxID=688394 RepID=A0A077X2I0_9FUNG|nr:hypothetical protein LRAMOSA05425 [Lichtheimia ramosa]
MLQFIWILFMATAALAQSVDDTGFKENDNTAAPEQESWLKKNDRYVFVIVIGLLIVGLLIWYIVRSVKGMRKRLALENEKQMYMLEQATAANPTSTMPLQQHGYQKFDTVPHHTHRY